ncbi:hypothetical protein B484DRAFT_195534 [Ochromonadaceae sp. CCMP2298]|nr:hypothetical protein B484DRAFT_195534 [Ochromonadaceae sp. CCMP2298]
MVIGKLVLLILLISTSTSSFSLGLLNGCRRCQLSLQLLTGSEGDGLVRSEEDGQDSRRRETASPPRGSCANVYWRAIDLEDLRAHPLFRPLPQVVLQHDPQSLSLFRQDSWQWDSLHEGRMTTSKASCCLGFYEGYASHYLGVPRSLQSHGRITRAWQQLSSKPPDSWDFLTADAREAAGAGGDSSGDSSGDSGGSVGVPGPPIWRQRAPRQATDASPSTSPSPRPQVHFPYSLHRPPPSEQQLQEQKARCGRDTGSARMAWGRAQEATAVLTALNYFSSDQSVVLEAGMFPLEALELNAQHQQWRQQRQRRGAHSGDVYDSLDRWQAEGSLPPLGASPDGILQHLDGSVEVLEVKCFSPFVRAQRGAVPVDDLMSVSMAPPRQGPGLASWHVPQLQLEMLCLGAHCRSAVVVTLAITGARVYRIERDDEYISEMLHLLRQFNRTYLTADPTQQLCPPPNFLNPRSDALYRAFLDRTRALAACSRLLAELGAEEIQRSPHSADFFV